MLNNITDVLICPCQKNKLCNSCSNNKVIKRDNTYLKSSNISEPHPWCNGYSALRECNRSRVRTPVKSNQRLKFT